MRMGMTPWYQWYEHMPISMILAARKREKVKENKKERERERERE